MVENIRDVEQALGNGIKTMQRVERELHRFARRSIYAVRAIRKGEPLTAANMAVLRSGKLTAGLEPKWWDQVLGRTARRDIAEGSPIADDDCGIDIA